MPAGKLDHRRQLPQIHPTGSSGGVGYRQIFPVPVHRTVHVEVMFKGNERPDILVTWSD